MTNFAYLFLMAQPAGTSGQSNPLVTFLPLILVFCCFLFLHDQATDEETKGDEQLQKLIEKRR